MSHPTPQSPDYGQQPGQYPPPGYGSQPPQKKSRGKWALGCLGLFVLFIVIVAGCSALAGGGGGDTTDPAPESTPAEVATAPADDIQDTPDAVEPTPEQTEDAAAGTPLDLSATSTGPASVTYGEGGSISTQDITGAWTETASVEFLEFYTVTVQDMSGDPAAEVTCTIVKDGETVAEEVGTGAYSIATCSSS